MLHRSLLRAARMTSEGLGGARRGSPDPVGWCAHGVGVAAGARAGPGDGRRRGARGGARHLGVCRGHPAAAAEGLGGLYWLVAGTVFPILVALFDAWVLLVEVNR